ncbi:MAG: DUF1778 domain-containing protein [Alphaproteobacteria bacterium]|jgi:uncharacterized protein (DUF1778 family)|nr:DUF1778 domain-containing protein [Alphaproteobacteria bacterium]
MPATEPKTERIEVRTTPSMKALLQRAASSSHKNVTEFLLEAGLNAAEEALVDRQLFRLDDAQWQAFEETRACSWRSEIAPSFQPNSVPVPDIMSIISIT